jgi:hypothetical protein
MRIWRLLALAGIVCGSVAAYGQPKYHEGTEKKKGTCVYPVFAIFDNYNSDAVQKGASAPSFDTRVRQPKARYCLVRIETYHWNNEKGAAPGTLGLTNITNGANINVKPGPWAATGTTGQSGVQNSNWAADAPASPPVILDGEYTVKDSSQNTWSGNAKAGKAFARIWVKEYVEPRAHD